MEGLRNRLVLTRELRRRETPSRNSMPRCVVLLIITTKGLVTSLLAWIVYSLFVRIKMNMKRRLTRCMYVNNDIKEVFKAACWDKSFSLGCHILFLIQWWFLHCSFLSVWRRFDNTKFCICFSFLVMKVLAITHLLCFVSNMHYICEYSHSVYAISVSDGSWENTGRCLVHFPYLLDRFQS